MIEISNLKFDQFNEFEMDIEEIKIKKGFNCLIGKNGSGKSTLLKIIANSIKPNCIKYKNETKTTNKNIQALNLSVFLHDSYGKLDDDLNIIKQISFSQTLYGKDNSRDYIEEIADRMNVKSLLDRKYSSLSSGQKNKILMLRTLCADTDIILFDEPTTALDISAIEGFIETVKSLDDKNKYIIISTHHPYEISILKPNIIAMKNGRIFDGFQDNKLQDPEETSKLLRELCKE